MIELPEELVMLQRSAREFVEQKLQPHEHEIEKSGEIPRSLLDEMMRGERTQDLAERFRMSPGRISQLRREFHDNWLCFTGENP